MNVRLTFINRSSAVFGADVVLLQKNVAPGMGELATAWKVIRNCGYGCRHPFVYTTDCEVSCNDPWGNHTPRLVVEAGQGLSLGPTAVGRRLVRKGPPRPSQEIEVANDLRVGAIDVNLFKDGRLLARKTSVAPAQKAVFLLDPVLWVGAVSEVVEGDAMDSAVLSEIDTELSLLGVASADIVMTGGGLGSKAVPYAFSLENVRTA